MSRYLILLLVPVACAAPDVSEPPEPPPAHETAAAETAATPEDEVRLPDRPALPEGTRGRRRQLERELQRALADNHWTRARELIGQLEELEIQPLIDEAHALLTEGDPAGALAVIERALEVAPGGPAARLVHGEAALQIGRRTWDTALIEAALASFEAAAAAPPRGEVDRWYRRAFKVHALEGAAQAARALGRKEDALSFASAELEWAVAQKDRRELYADLTQWPERTYVDAAYDVFLDVHETDPERAAELVAEMEKSLSFLMAHRPRDAWAWSRLTAVLLVEERFQDALDAALGGLGKSPDDRTLPGQAAEAARGVGGSEEVLAVFARLRERAPRAPLSWWYPARERFEAAVERLDERPVDELRRAEADFRRCRELDAEYAQACLGFEAMCRNAVGWIHYEAGDLRAAADAFRSMEDLFPRGMTWQVEERLLSGVEGLRFVADKYVERDDLFAAARLFLELHEYEPENANWANNAGFFHREAGSRLDRYAAEATSMSGGDLKTVEQRAVIVEAAGLDAPANGEEAVWRKVLGEAGPTLEERSRAMFETSYEAYLAASELAPDDVRIVNDTALIAIHHLNRDLDRAEESLLHCVELGAAQLEAADDLDEDERRDLTEAWGDAHENLGVLYLEHRSDPETARGYFLRSLEIGPFPRPVVTNYYLPRCEEMIAKKR